LRKRFWERENKMLRVAVVGLGRFGSTLAMALTEMGHEVIAIDSSAELVEEIQDSVTLAVRLDATEEKALVAQGIDKVDVAIVSIGEEFEGNTLVTVLLKKLRIKKVIARAQTPMRARILELVGADEIIRPEEDSALRLANRLANPSILSYIELTAGHSLLQVGAPRKFCGQTLAELDLRRKYRLNIIAIKRPSDSVAGGYEVLDVPSPDDQVQRGDILVIVGSDENLKKLPVD